MERNRMLVPDVPITHPLLSFTWEELPQLPVAMDRAQFAWWNGRFYVGGGVAERDSRDRRLFYYFPESRHWASMYTPTSFYGLTIFEGNLVLVGGEEHPSYRNTNKIWVLQSSDENCEEELIEGIIPAMPTKRSGVSAVGHNELLLVAGGEGQTEVIDTVELYSSILLQWRSVEPLPRPCSFISSTIVGSYIVFAGGWQQRMEFFRCSLKNLSTQLHWERLVGTPLRDRTTIASINDVLLTIGGKVGNFYSTTMLGFSTSTKTWHYFCDLPLPLSCVCIGLTPTGQILAIGGWTKSRRSSRVFQLCIQDEAALRLSNIILKSVQSGLFGVVERALTLVKKTFHPSKPDGSLLLDFLAHNPSPNQSSSAEYHTLTCSPLMIACDNEDTKMVDVLLKNRASPAFKNKDGVTALHVACSKDNLNLVQQLVYSDGTLTKLSIKLLQMTDKNGQNVLHYACGSHFKSDCLKWLLENNIHALHDMLNQKNNIGRTPLLTACENANLVAVEVLVTHDEIDIGLCDEKGQGALHLAAMQDSSSIVELLLTKKCPSDTQDYEGNTALHIAYKKSSSSVISVLAQVDDGRIALILNNAGQRPVDIEPEDIIPPEILKKGANAVQLYFEALKCGKKQIPHCNFLILGEERVGKTSVYRLLVCKPFNPNQDSTRGIDNTIVNTVDTRLVGAENWAEKDEHTFEQYADQMFVEGIIGALPSDFLAASDASTPIVTVNESKLNEEISELESMIPQILSGKNKPPTITEVQQTPPINQTQIQTTDLQQEPESQIHKRDFRTKVESQVSDLSQLVASSQSAQAASDVPIVSRKYAKLIDEGLLIAAASNEQREEAVLILNTLDFAGQKQYRPMHHCFLSRRAMYLVVFNLQHVIQYIEQKCMQQTIPPDLNLTNPFEEIRYWLHSIHAHTLPAVPDKQRKPMKNVLLVGTHRSPSDESKGRTIKDKELDDINNLIIEEICSDDRCSCHLHLMGPKGDQVFIAVENSIDGKDLKDREASGAKALQEEINLASQCLPFLREKYPVIWFRFDSELSRLKESLKQKQSSLLITVEEVLKIAMHCGITDPDGQLLSLEFFHETGKIICLKFIPSLFISEQEHSELEELVLLDPTWLIDVMMNVVELNCRLSIEGKDLNQLRETGVASCDLLKEAWSGYIRDPVKQSFDKMCLILQAEALIHPVRIHTELPLELSTSESTVADEKLAYLVPGKLPEKIKKEPVKSSRWTTFYFDFQKFLPEEIYHRLLCMLLAGHQKSKSLDKPYLSKNECQFNDIDNCHWSIKFEREHHRLKISFLSRKTDHRSPADHIDAIHTQYLQRICVFSNLEGLRYVGGPLLDPCPECGETNVIRYVYYYEGEDRPSKSECPQCLEMFDVNKLLNNQVRGCGLNAIRKSTSGSSNKDDNDHEQKPSSSAMEAQSDYGRITLTDKPTLQQLQVLKVGGKQRVRVIDSTAAAWEEVAIALGFEPPHMNCVKRDNAQNVKGACRQILINWLNGEGTPELPVTWETLIECLIDAGQESVAEDLRQILSD